MKRAIKEIVNYGAFVDGLFSVVDRGGLEKIAREMNIKGVSIFNIEDF